MELPEDERELLGLQLLKSAGYDWSMLEPDPEQESQLAELLASRIASVESGARLITSAEAKERRQRQVLD